jgi:kumamolisin
VDQITPVKLFLHDPIDPATGAVPAGIVTSGYLTPPQIVKAYGIPSSTGLGVKIGIIGLGGGFYQSDLNSSFTDLRTAGLIPSTTATPIIEQVLLDGATGDYSSNTGASVENTIDIYCVATTVPEADITMYIGKNTFPSFRNLIDRAISDGCHIITISWGTTEPAGLYGFLEPSLLNAANAKITVCVASGDWGSSFAGQNSLQIYYPSSSLYVISVGGTNLTLGAGDSRLVETDDNRNPQFGDGWGGGGGLSKLFSLPPWQSGLYYTPIVDSVIGSPTALTVRGIPDISAPMNVYALYLNSVVGGAGGTSLAAPLMAGVLARYQQLTGIQRSSVEYNEIFYANPGAFYDIVVGTNNTQSVDGYAGTSGWDCVTGLGPPIGTALYDLLRPVITYPTNNYRFPKNNYGLRPATGAVYPRRTVGAR